MGETLSEIDAAVAALRRGAIVVAPTDTVYGIVAMPQRAAIRRIYVAKRRSADKPLQLLIAGSDWLQRLAAPSAAANRLAARFWPGPLTLVVAAGSEAPAICVQNGTIGLRVPNHPVALALVAASGPLAATSANRSGEPTPADLASIREMFGDAVEVYLDGGRIEERASTVVDVSKRSPAILRAGPIPRAEIAQVAGVDWNPGGTL